MEKVLFVELGFGNDQHGQDPTKACVRQVQPILPLAAEKPKFNSIPSINSIVPGGYDNMKLRIQLAVPVPEEEVDIEAVKRVFPYGKILPIEFQRGGMLASSGIELPQMGGETEKRFFGRYANGCTDGNVFFPQFTYLNPVQHHSGGSM
ncbi:unnamed protein product [Choristocarpus tenellus]